MNPPPRYSAQLSLPLGSGLDPAGVLERLRGQHAPWLLESALRMPGQGRHSFVGADPYLVLRSRGDRVETECRRAVHEGLRAGRESVDASTLEVLRALLPPAPHADPALPFCGGAVGVFGYELAEQLDVHHLHGEDDLGLPDAYWLFVDALVAFDHERGDAWISGTGFADDPQQAERRARDAADRFARLLEGGSTSTSPSRAPERAAPAGEHSELDLAAYRKALDTVGAEIAAGEIYQACLTYRVDRPFSGDPWQLYRELRRRDPAPFAAYLELPELALVGCSPERFLRVDADGGIESRPIKGTAPRGRDPDEDAVRRDALAASEKDRAENLMIVDLVRNDLGRVCETGSVEVPDLFAVEPYAAVFQLVSTVRGRLREGYDALDAVAASFPPGSMTGAPKIAAMRVLDRLETLRRGFYSGALGYLDLRGGLDLSVVIRSAFLREGRAYLHTGGGLVADSDAAGEYAETRAKLASLLDALEACEPRTPGTR